MRGLRGLGLELEGLRRLFRRLGPSEVQAYDREAPASQALFPRVVSCGGAGDMVAQMQQPSLVYKLQALRPWNSLSALNP